MKISNPRFAASVCALAVMCSLPMLVRAADQPFKFAVPNSQIQALGIQTIPLSSQAESVKQSFPAQVVVPARAEQVVSSPLAGLVAQLLVQENDRVRAGSPLVRIASPELGQLQLQLMQASTRATLARQAAQREQALFDDGIIPQRRVQEAQAALKEAEATLQQTQAALRMSGLPSSTIDRIASSGKPQDSITLTASQAGIVTEVAAKTGQRVEAASLLLRVAQIDTLWLDIQLPASQIAGWPPGTKLNIAGRDITARVLSTGAGISASSQTAVLRAVIENKNAPVRPGEFVTVELPAAASAGSWDVPLAAVAHDGGQAYVFVRAADGFEARPVKLVLSAGQRVRVQGALKEGEQIASSGIVALKGAWLAAKEKK